MTSSHQKLIPVWFVQVGAYMNVLCAHTLNRLMSYGGHARMAAIGRLCAHTYNVNERMLGWLLTRQYQGYIT